MVWIERAPAKINLTLDVLEKRKEPGIVIMTGSLYLLAQWRHILQEVFRAQ